MPGISPIAVAVRERLRKHGLETPMRAERPTHARIAEIVKDLMIAFGLDLADPSLADTPKRVGRMLVSETFAGLDYSNFPRMMAVPNMMAAQEGAFNDFVMQSGITVHSTCEHHLVTIEGLAHVAYVPREKILGLSKLNRLVDFFSRRPQIQERLTWQIAHAVSEVAESDDVVVFVQATHFCVRLRGVRDQNSEMSTLACLGAFNENGDLRRDFLRRTV